MPASTHSPPAAVHKPSPDRPAVSRLFAILLEAIEQRIPHFRGRTKRVVEIACQIGRLLRLSDVQMGHLRLAATFHDLGYLAVPDDAVNTQQPPSDEQKRLLDRHLHYGSQILSTVYPNLPDVVEAVLYHHERPDGRGPFGLQADEIPLLSRIIAVAEAIEAMTSQRAHRRQPMQREAVLNELRSNVGSQFDSRVVMAAGTLGEELFDWLVSNQRDSHAPTELPSTGQVESKHAADEQAAPEQQPPDGQDATAPTSRPQPLMDRRQLLNRLHRSLELKAMPAVLHQIMSLTSSARVSIDQVAEAVKQDQAISLRILRLANSSLYARGAPLQDIRRAVLRLGLQTIRELVMSIAVIGQFGPKDAPEEALDRRYFWEHGLGCALIACELARACQSGQSERAFTAGLLHDVGRVVLDEFFAQPYQQVLEFARQRQMPLEWAELKLLSMTHADVSQQLLTQWRFPAHLIAPIAGHHLSVGNMKRYVPSDIQIVAIVALADRLAHAMLIGHSANDAIYRLDDLSAELGLTDDMVRWVGRNALDRTNEIKYGLIIGAGAQPWRPFNEVVAEWLQAPTRLLSISRSKGPNVYSILFEQIPVSQPDQPNLALVELRSREDIVPCGQALLQAEAQAGVKDLPVIMLCSSQDLRLSPKLLSSRKGESLRTPTSLRQLIETARRLLTEA
ncbi:MAG: HDOD domain-containing protein [Phycisphaerae bacterium]